MSFDCECITHLCEKHGGPDIARGLIDDYETKLAKATNTQLWQEYYHQQDVYEARIEELKKQLNKCKWELEQARGGISRDNIHTL